MRAGDAWQVLGLTPAPTVESVKRAYRNLAKSLHPDAVGGRSRPAAFARLTEAYEVALAESLAANRHGPAAARPAPSPRVRPRRATLPEEPAQDHDMERPRARPGSTTYDGTSASDGDQVWDGAQWVGADSGTYWRVNPKEYADPRKHGAEYRARGKRPIRRDPRPSRQSYASATGSTGGGSVAEWPRMEWRLFNALVAWAPLLAAEPLLPGIAVELLLFGLLMLAPRLAWSGTRGSVALLVVALPWSLAATFGLPLPSTEGVGLVVALIWASAYVCAALLSWSGRLSPRPWVARDAGFEQDAG
jgi:curved DNA-binding protein CbpA